MTGNNTLDRIQKEIKESLQREDELRSKYEMLNNNCNGNVYETNGIDKNINGNDKNLNGIENASTQQVQMKPNGWRRFTQNTTKRGVMQKFLKMRGKVSQPTLSTNKSTSNSNGWTFSDQPARITVETGKAPRNGFISAEEKMKRELNEFQKREKELRDERRKSQPDLMASLQLEEQQNGYDSDGMNNSSLKSAKSMANLYINNDDKDEIDCGTSESYSSAPCSLKPARSLAALCDVSNDELEMPGTYSLIMQFEKMKRQTET